MPNFERVLHVVMIHLPYFSRWPSEVFKTFIFYAIFFVRWETITSICIHFKNFINLTVELWNCFCRHIRYQAKHMGKRDVIWLVQSHLTHFMSLIYFCAPWKREKRKQCYFNFSPKIMNGCYLRHLLELHLKCHSYHSENLIKSNVLLLLKE